MNTNTLQSSSRWMLLAAAVLLIISIFAPIWRIELSAPQYPEGLAMQIFSYKLGGDVEIINGLNHYIGMETLHAENFIEFTVLPYIIAFFVLFTLVAALLAKRSVLYVLLICFLLFGVLAMVDFWRWEYNYGHNLDPNAAIIVPGMAYQPPLIGYKQLLNFGAFSIPDIGGWLFMLSGVLMLLAVAMEKGWLDKLKRPKKVLILLPFSVFLMNCASDGPEAILWNKDQCHDCKMSISDDRFGTELITEKGRVYKFDDLSCMLRYTSENNDVAVKAYYVCDYLSKGVLIPAESASFVFSRSFKSPMRGDIAAFKTAAEAETYATKNGTKALVWEDVKGMN